MIRLATKLEAETLKLCSAETEPIQALNTFSVPDTDIIGVGMTMVATTKVLVLATQPVVVFLATA